MCGLPCGVMVGLQCVIVVFLDFVVSWVGLQCKIVVFPDHFLLLYSHYAIYSHPTALALLICNILRTRTLLIGSTKKMLQYSLCSREQKLKKIQGQMSSTIYHITMHFCSFSPLFKSYMQHM